MSLYLVKKNGVDVEAVSGIWELFLKKTGLDQVVSILESLFAMFLSNINSYPMFIEAKKIIDAILEKVVEIVFTIQQLTSKSKI